MSEITKYLEFVFKDFPETEEVAAEKEKILGHMQDVYKEKLSFGSAKVDALEAALDAVGDIRELHRKLEVKEVNIPKVYQLQAGEYGSLKTNMKRMAAKVLLLIILAICMSIIILIVKSSLIASADILAALSISSGAEDFFSDPQEWILAGLIQLP
jgi:hypothetical protein